MASQRRCFSLWTRAEGGKTFANHFLANHDKPVLQYINIYILDVHILFKGVFLVNVGGPATRKVRLEKDRELGRGLGQYTSNLEPQLTIG